MSRYRKIDPRIWNDEKVRRLNDESLLVLLFTLTHPAMTAIGAMRATVQGLAAERRWSATKFGRALDPIVRAGIVEFDEEACCLALPKFLKYNPPEGPNSLYAWVKAIDDVPECAVRRRVMARCRAWLDAQGERYRKAVATSVWSAFPSGMDTPHPSGMDTSPPCPIQEQEQEQEQDTTPLPPPSGGASADGFADFWAAWPKARRVNKADAVATWRKLRPSSEVRAKILAAVAPLHAREPRYIPHPHRWLAKRRWEDEVAAAHVENPYAAWPELWDCGLEACGGHPTEAERDACRASRNGPRAPALASRQGARSSGDEAQA